MGGYYRSAWFRYANINDLVGIAQNSVWNVGWDKYNFMAGAMNRNEVKEAYELAVAAGVPMDPGTD